MKILRREALATLLVIAGAAVIYFTFLFDAHLRWMLSWGLGEINSAQVDVARLRTGFFPPKILIQQIALTQPDQPTRNRLEIGELDFALNGDALLRGKFVIEHALITGVSGGGVRPKPGKVFTPIASNPDTAVGKLWVRLKDEAAQTGLGQVAQLLQGFDPRAQLSKLGDLSQLASLKKMTELQSQIAAKKGEWEKSLAQIPGETEIARLQSRVSGLSIGGNPAQIQSQISEATQLVGDSQGLVQSVQQKSAGLIADVDAVSKAGAAIPEWVAKDQRELEGRLKLPSLDAASISAQLMGPRIFGLLQLAEPYLHGGSTKAGAKASSRAGTRMTGRIYEFGRLKSIPGFWLKQGKLSGTAGAGSVQAKFLNLSSQPGWVSEVPTVDFKADHFPVEAVPLTEVEGMKLTITRALSTGSLVGRFAGSALAIRGDAQLSDAQYAVAAQPALLQDLLKDATGRLKNAQMGLEITGSWDAPQFKFSSSIGDAIAAAVRSRLDAQVAQVRQEISRKVHAQVDEKQKAVTGQLESARGSVLSEVNSRQKQAEAVRAQAQAKVAQAKAQLSRSATDGLRRKLPF